MGGTEKRRGQSESLAVLLLAAIVVAAFGIVGYTVLNNANIDAETVTVDTQITVTNAQITVEHNGGDTLNASEVAVVVRNETGESRQQAPISGQFEPGDSFTVANPYSGTVTVIVVHDASNTVIGEATKTVE